MKRVIVTALIVLAALPSVASARVEHPAEQCRYRRGGRWSDGDVKSAIRCAVGKWGVSGGVHKALAVARCESGYNEHDRNPTSSAAGVFQFIAGTWSSVKAHYAAVRRRYGLSGRVMNARANVMLAIRYAHAGGWQPWSCG